jgi:hypothetical protein
MRVGTPGSLSVSRLTFVLRGLAFSQADDRDPHFFGGIAILSFGTVLIVVAQTAEDFQLKIVTTSAPELGRGDYSQLGAAWRTTPESSDARNGQGSDAHWIV